MLNNKMVNGNFMGFDEIQWDNWITHEEFIICGEWCDMGHDQQLCIVTGLHPIRLEVSYRFNA